ncbi:hypothetical protein JOM56_001852 [Amanita muscaria]
MAASSNSSWISGVQTLSDDADGVDRRHVGKDNNVAIHQGEYWKMLKIRKRVDQLQLLVRKLGEMTGVDRNETTHSVLLKIPRDQVRRLLRISSSTQFHPQLQRRCESSQDSGISGSALQWVRRLLYTLSSIQLQQHNSSRPSFMPAFSVYAGIAQLCLVWRNNLRKPVLSLENSSIDVDRSYHNGLFVLGKSAMPDRQSKICCPKIKFGAVQVGDGEHSMHTCWLHGIASAKIWAISAQDSLSRAYEAQQVNNRTTSGGVTVHGLPIAKSMIIETVAIVRQDAKQLRQNYRGAYGTTLVYDSLDGFPTITYFEQLILDYRYKNAHLASDSDLDFLTRLSNTPAALQNHRECHAWQAIMTGCSGIQRDSITAKGVWPKASRGHWW